MAQARKILDKEHYGLDKVKERMLEFIAVRQLNPDAKGKILCLVGPPGVGKTSVAMSVARGYEPQVARGSVWAACVTRRTSGATGRPTSAPCRGASSRRCAAAGTMNPLLVLDEIDKLASDMRGDPAAALLEVLDSEQNGAFRDHFVEVPVDLSRVMFITTANTTATIPRPLLDRMEVIELASYTDEEKLQIAQRAPAAQADEGARPDAARQLRLDDDALRRIITDYTRESGVRTLERQLGKLCRKSRHASGADGCKADRRYSEGAERLSGHAALRRGHPQQDRPGRRGQRPCLDRGGRRAAGGGGRCHGRHRQAGADGQSGSA